MKTLVVGKVHGLGKNKKSSLGTYMLSNIMIISSLGLKIVGPCPTVYWIQMMWVGLQELCCLLCKIISLHLGRLESQIKCWWSKSDVFFFSS